MTSMPVDGSPRSLASSGQGDQEYPDLDPTLSMPTTNVASASSLSMSSTAAVDISHSIFWRNPRRPCIKLPPQTSDSRDFVGREAYFDAISDAILPDSGQQKSTQSGWPNFITLTGSGGVGKTEVALEFARRHTKDFDAIFWVQASSRQKLDEAFNSILMHLYPRTTDRNQCQNQPGQIMSYSISRELLKIWLSNPYKPPCTEDYDVDSSGHPNVRAKWLLIFDSVTCLEDLFEFIPKGNGAVLVTSRDSRVETFGAIGMKGLTVPTLSNDGQ